MNLKAVNDMQRTWAQLMGGRCLLAGLLAAVAVLFALTACSAQSGVAVRDNVDAYSWSELSAISEEIASAGDNAAAVEVAKRYHLTTEDGKLDGSQSKAVELADGTQTRAVVAGFAHDERAGGEKAGITFVFEDAVALHEMNNDAGYKKTAMADDLDTLGGWNASDMRSWLNGEFVYELPSDLRASLADVTKTSLVVPEREVEMNDGGALLPSVDSLVGTGVDKLWIPAVVEVSGVSSKSSAGQEYPEWNVPLKAEGSQYQLFSDCKVAESSANSVLVRSLPNAKDEAQRWWLRSVEDWTFAEVLEDGSVDRRDKVPAAGTAQAVVPCFAI